MRYCVRRYVNHYVRRLVLYLHEVFEEFVVRWIDYDVRWRQHGVNAKEHL